MTENSTFGTTTSARVMIEAGHSKDFAYICFTFPEEPNKAVMAINRRFVLHVETSLKSSAKHVYLT